MHNVPLLVSLSCSHGRLIHFQVPCFIVIFYYFILCFLYNAIQIISIYHPKVIQPAYGTDENWNQLPRGKQQHTTTTKAGPELEYRLPDTHL